jgi:hypothetical protein
LKFFFLSLQYDDEEQQVLFGKAGNKTLSRMVQKLKQAGKAIPLQALTGP